MPEEIKSVIEKINEQKEFLDKQFNGINEKMTNFENRLKEVEKLQKEKFKNLNGVEDEKEKFSFLRMVWAIKTNDWSKAGFEKEVLEQAKKDMSAGNDTAGGYLVPPQVMTDVIELLRAKAVVIKMGATVISDLYGSPVEIPKITGGATAYWVAENSAGTSSDLSTGQLQLIPHQLMALTKISNRLIKLSNPSAEAIVRKDMAKAMAVALDYAALRGDGTSNQPVGIANTTGINTVSIGTNGGDFTWDIAIDMEEALESADALDGSLGYVMHPKVKRKLKQYKASGSGEYMVLPFTDAKLKETLGYDFATTTQIPTNLTKGTGTNLSEVYFGNWEELIIGQWGGLEVLVSNTSGTAFETNQTWIRMIQEADIGIRHPESFCLVSDAAT